MVERVVAPAAHSLHCLAPMDSNLPLAESVLPAKLAAVHLDQRSAARSMHFGPAKLLAYLHLLFFREEAQAVAEASLSLT